MNKSALIYAWTIIAIGAAVLLSAAFYWQSADGTAFGVCLALAVFASTLKLKLTGLTQTISPAFVFVLVSVALLSWPETVVIAASAGLVQCLWRPRATPRPVQAGFAAGGMAVAGGLAHGVTWVPPGETDAMTALLGIAGVVLLLTNTLIVATVLCLIREAPFNTIWRSVQCRAVPYYLAGGIVANVWARTKLTVPLGMALLAATSVYLLSICFRQLDLQVFQPREGS
jgi:hypothetical protein